MDVIIDFLFDLYLEFVFCGVPGKLGATKKQRGLAYLAATSVFVVSLGLFVWGLWAIFSGKTVIGWVLVSAACFITLIHIIGGFWLRKKH